MMSARTPSLSSINDFKVRKHCSTGWRTISAIPFDPLLPFADISVIARSPVRFTHVYRELFAGS